MASALQDALNLLIDETLSIPKLGPYGPRGRMTGAIFARQVSAAPGQLGILGAQAHDHVGRQRLGDRPGIAAAGGDARNLIVFGVSLGRLNPGFDELVVEVADLLVVDRHPLRRDEVVAGAEILDRLVGG